MQDCLCQLPLAALRRGAYELTSLGRLPQRELTCNLCDPDHVGQEHGHLLSVRLPIRGRQPNARGLQGKVPHLLRVPLGRHAGWPAEMGGTQRRQQAHSGDRSERRVSQPTIGPLFSTQSLLMYCPSSLLSQGEGEACPPRQDLRLRIIERRLPFSFSRTRPQFGNFVPCMTLCSVDYMQRLARRAPLRTQFVSPGRALPMRIYLRVRRSSDTVCPIEMRCESPKPRSSLSLCLCASSGCCGVPTSSGCFLLYVLTGPSEYDRPI